MASKKGFGDIMLAKLQEVPHASTDELAAHAGVTPQQAYSRLLFIEKTDGRVASVGKGTAKVWHLSEKTAPVEQAKPSEADGPKDGTAGCKAETDALGYEIKRGWKPSHRGLVPLSPDENVAIGDKLLVEYPERWRHSVAASVRRLPDDKGIALCSEIGTSQSCYIDVRTFRERGWKVSRLGKKDVERLFGK